MLTDIYKQKATCTWYRWLIPILSNWLLIIYSCLYPSVYQGFAFGAQKIKAAFFYSVFAFAVYYHRALLRLLR